MELNLSIGKEEGKNNQYYGELVDEKKQITRVQVKRLFDSFDYDINFQNEKNISILIAPNGCGKTTILNFIDFLCNPSTTNYLKSLNIPVESIKLTFKNGLTVEYKKNKKLQYKHLSEVFDYFNYSIMIKMQELKANLNCIDFAKEQLKNFDLAQEQIKKNAKIFAEQAFNGNYDFLVGDNYILNIDENGIKVKIQLTDLSEDYLHYVRNHKSANINQLTKIIYDYAMNICKKQFDKTIAEIITKQLSECKDLPRINYIPANRFLNLSRLEESNIVATRVPHPDLAKISKEKKQFLKFDSFSSAEKNLISKNILKDNPDFDIEQMFSVYEYQAILTKQQIELFTKIFNERNKHTGKRIIFKDNFRYEIKQNGHIIQPRMLSSGEKNDFYMFFMLVFNTYLMDVIIIDEPEISLHVDWQTTFLDHVEQICKLNKTQVIIATHSPDIINGHTDLLAQKKVKSYVKME